MILCKYSLFSKHIVHLHQIHHSKINQHIYLNSSSLIFPCLDIFHLRIIPHILYYHKSINFQIHYIYHSLYMLSKKLFLFFFFTQNIHHIIIYFILWIFPFHAFDYFRIPLYGSNFSLSILPHAQPLTSNHSPVHQHKHSFFIILSTSHIPFFFIKLNFIKTYNNYPFFNYFPIKISPFK